jgi:hypothetical protein
VNTGKLKNAVIILLGVLTLYQTSGLWFEDMSSYNLFSDFSKTQTVQTLEQDFTNPKNIVIGFGNKNFNQFFMDEKGKILNNKTDESIRYIMKNGEYVETKSIDWNELLSYREVICSYSSLMPMEEYAKAMGAKSIPVFSSKQKKFDMLIVVPARSAGDYSKIYFVNTDERNVALFSAEKNKSRDDLLSEIENIQKDTANTSYVSTYQSGFNMFNDNVFLPQSTDKKNVFPAVTISKLADINQRISAHNVDAFFQNPVAKLGGEKDHNGIYTFSDENVVVRFYPSGLFEYFNYEFISNNINTSFGNAFKAALGMIQKSSISHQNIYLSSVKKEDADVWRFGFDYYVEDFPVILSDDIKNEMGIEHMIEVTVKKGIVSNYKSYACDIEVSNKSKEISVDFLKALNSVMDDRLTEEVNIKNMYLAYEITAKSTDADLVWVMDMDKDSYIEATGVK